MAYKNGEMANAVGRCNCLGKDSGATSLMLPRAFMKYVLLFSAVLWCRDYSPTLL